MRYVDGFVIVIPKKNLSAYKKMAKDGCRVWKKHGALEYMECVADDVNPPWVGVTFPRLTKAKPTETVLFSFIVYKSRKHRDSVNAKVMAEYDKKNKAKPVKMPFDMKKVSYAGFQAIVQG